jgi:replicative DNA helicase
MALISSRDFLSNWTPARPLTPPTLKTGFRIMDEATGGLQPGRIHIVAGRPGMGVSTTLRSIAINVLHQGARVLYCTSGSPIESEIVRMLSNISHRVPVDDIEWDSLNDEQAELLRAARTTLAECCLSFSKEIELTKLIEDGEAFLANSADKPSLIVIDNPIRLDEKGASIGRTLFNLAYENQVPILIAGGACPSADLQSLRDSCLADVAETRDTIDFADVVLLLRREEVYSPDTEERGFACLKVVRNRGKSIGRYQFANFFGETSSIRHDESIANWRPS